jgi:protein-S-isoprenylcysteine O-methyltransferase Ste14
MTKTIILFLVWAAIVGVWLIPRWFIPVIKHRIVGEIAEAAGILVFITLLTICWLWMNQRVPWLAYVGFALYAPSAFFVISSFINLKQKGKAEKGWEDTTVLIRSGIFRILRHPMYFGTALWAMAMAFIQQSIPAIVLAVIVISCTYVASRGEDKQMIEKFGDAYREYMKNVPMWPLIH